MNYFCTRTFLFNCLEVNTCVPNFAEVKRRKCYVILSSNREIGFVKDEKFMIYDVFLFDLDDTLFDFR